jgi:RNA polymerase sigma-70 factor (ECF subfamily)
MTVIEEQTMTDSDVLARRFEEHRPRLRAMAYRMLGSLSEADDAVQEAWLRLSRVSADEIDNLGAWLTTVVARVSLNLLRSRRTRREEPFGAHIPEPVVDPADGVDPEHEALLADAVGLALLVVLDELSPPERLAFVLHDMFSIPFDEIAALTGRSPEAARQLASRAPRPSTPSTPPRATATSTPWSRFSTPTWCSGPTPSLWRSTVRRPWPVARRPSPACRSRSGR